MSSEAPAVIRVAGIGKRYRLRHDRAARYTALRDVLANALRRREGEAPAVEDFWALQDISFEVGKGDILGVIGRNGAGKSTLLKILSHITEPTTGRIELDGRVASLLEVGTGFHPELTGRENIFLNGAILGMPRREIASKFDEIVAFAETEKFLDTPVKHYSSGMYVRLAFSVAAHLEPEILVVDEVLAVGDAEFQKKCIGKMQDVSQGGRTVLFVSHNFQALSSLCNRGLVLKQGRVSFDGGIDEALAHYSHADPASRIAPRGRDKPRVLSVEVDEEAARNAELRIRVHFDSPWELSPPRLGVVISASNGAPVFGFNTDMDPEFESIAAARGELELRVRDAPLHTGLYRAAIWFGERNTDHHVLRDAALFHFVAPTAIPAGVGIETIGSTRVQGRFRYLPPQ